LKKKLDMLKKTREINEILEKGEIEEQALLNSAEDIHPIDEYHTLELLDRPNRIGYSARTRAGARKKTVRTQSTGARSKVKVTARRAGRRSAAVLVKRKIVRKTEGRSKATRKK